mgnify:CR=1 FL=1
MPPAEGMASRPSRKSRPRGTPAPQVGVPVVGTNAGGIPFVIEHEKTGLLVDEDATDEQWASALCSLLEDPQARQRMGRAAREEAERYSWRESTKALVAAYEYACRHPYHHEQP